MEEEAAAADGVDKLNAGKRAFFAPSSSFALGAASAGAPPKLLAPEEVASPAAVGLAAAPRFKLPIAPVAPNPPALAPNPNPPPPNPPLVDAAAPKPPVAGAPNGGAAADAAGVPKDGCEGVAGGAGVWVSETACFGCFACFGWFA